jgi:hypothetical protein
MGRARRGKSQRHPCQGGQCGPVFRRQPYSPLWLPHFRLRNGPSVFPCLRTDAIQRILLRSFAMSCAYFADHRGSLGCRLPTLSTATGNQWREVDLYSSIEPLRVHLVFTNWQQASGARTSESTAGGSRRKGARAPNGWQTRAVSEPAELKNRRAETWVLAKCCGLGGPRAEDALA